jgi:hypothetical protein|tara:strand:- start:385 stop:702 length:318 start_codon:yes stop_codon:yes gene_type:complete
MLGLEPEPRGPEAARGELSSLMSWRSASKSFLRSLVARPATRMGCEGVGSGEGSGDAARRGEASEDGALRRPQQEEKAEARAVQREEGIVMVMVGEDGGVDEKWL